MSQVICCPNEPRELVIIAIHFIDFPQSVKSGIHGRDGPTGRDEPLKGEVVRHQWKFSPTLRNQAGGPYADQQTCSRSSARPPRIPA